jgi:hypothetical protein
MVVLVKNHVSASVSATPDVERLYNIVLDFTLKKWKRIFYVSTIIDFTLRRFA